MDERNIRLLLEYDGTNYHGWQRQDNALSIQEILENAIKQLTQEKAKTIAAGRTDTGVHARGQVVNFKLKKYLPLHKIQLGLNTNLPSDIVVKKVEEVPKDFHARFDAKKRIYQYFISLERTAIYRNYSWQFFKKLNIEILKRQADLLLGEHDFGAFAKNEVSGENKICRIYKSQWKLENGFLVYRVIANRFLHGMVRTLVGTMTDVARGRFKFEQFDQVLKSRDRTTAGVAAPPHGLFLEEVKY